MVATAIFSIASVALASIFMFSIKSFASMANYAILDIENREALDLLTRELRQARQVKSYVTNSSGNSLTFVNDANEQITYSFNAAEKQFLRTAPGSSEVLLTNCDLLNFSLFQRNPSNGNYGVFPVAFGNWTQSVKVVQLTWRTSRAVPTGPVNSENIQTARIIIRKQQD
jgi:type II secretory pathway component PulJ